MGNVILLHGKRIVYTIYMYYIDPKYNSYFMLANTLAALAKIEPVGDAVYIVFFGILKSQTRKVRSRFIDCQKSCMRKTMGFVFGIHLQYYILIAAHKIFLIHILLCDSYG